METSLHRDLKTLYVGQDAQFEVSLGGYRIDVMSGGHLVEIQHGSLAAIRDKVKTLLNDHPPAGRPLKTALQQVTPRAEMMTRKAPFFRWQRPLRNLPAVFTKHLAG